MNKIRLLQYLCPPPYISCWTNALHVYVFIRYVIYLIPRTCCAPNDSTHEQHVYQKKTLDCSIGDDT
jgi:hypothetical protein